MVMRYVICNFSNISISLVSGLRLLHSNRGNNFGGRVKMNVLYNTIFPLVFGPTVNVTGNVKYHA